MAQVYTGYGLVDFGGAAFLSSMTKQMSRKEPALARYLLHEALGLGKACFDLEQMTVGVRAAAPPAD